MKITLITACYNSAPVIWTAFESVLKQNWTDLEYLVIDGGSTDGTVEIIREIEPRFAGRMRWVSEKDKGFYDAVNKGIRMATGEVVGILNADDFFPHENVLTHVAHVFEESGIESVFGNVQFVRDANLKKPVRYYSSKYFRPWLVKFGYLPAHPTFYCRRQLFGKYGFYQTDYKIAADHELLIRFLVGKKIRSRYLSEVFVVMRTGGMSTRSVHSTLIINRENIRACRANGVYTNQLMQLARYLFKLPGLVFRNGY